MVEAFELAAGASQAVISRPMREADRLAVSDRELYATYYQQIQAEHRSPSADDWDRRRRVADEATFPGYKESIRFAALSLDGEGVASYGAFDHGGFCYLVLRNAMIEQRASVFEENTTLAFERHRSRMPTGQRATWDERAKLCVAKLADELNRATLPEEFPGVLVRQATAVNDERFVEVHIFGPMSVRTLERVLLKPGRGGRHRPSIVRALRERLRKYDVPLEER